MKIKMKMKKRERKEKKEEEKEEEGKQSKEEKGEKHEAFPMIFFLIIGLQTEKLEFFFLNI